MHCTQSIYYHVVCTLHGTQELFCIFSKVPIIKKSYQITALTDWRPTEKDLSFYCSVANPSFFIATTDE